MRSLIVAAIVMAIGCTGNEAQEPVAPAVIPASNPVPVLPLPGISATYVMTLVNDKPLPVKSPFGFGEWDYDSDAQTWLLTAATLTLDPSGGFIENTTHRAASGRISKEDLYVGTYKRLSASSLEFSDGHFDYRYTGEMSASRLILRYPGGGTNTFEQ